MSEAKDNPGFIYDDGKNSFTPAVASNNTENNYAVELKDLKKSKEVDDEYDPYLNREIPHPTTNLETLFHLLKGSLGTGILSMPSAFVNSGYLIGSVITVLIGALCTYCIHLLIKAEYELCKRRKEPSLTYPATAEAAMMEGPPVFRKMAPYSGHVVNTFLLIFQLGTCCVYTVFIADNIKDVVDKYIDVENEMDVKIYMLIILLPLILINYLRNLKLLAPFSTLANGITVVSFGIILYYLITNGKIQFENRDAFGEVQNFPLFLGTVLFALEAVGVIMPLENEMRTPKAFGGTIGVLNIAMVAIVFLYTGMGLLGYLAYGSETAGTITLSIGDDIPAQVAKIMLSLAIYISHALQMYVAVDITWNQYLFRFFEKSRLQVFWEYCLRTFLVLITFGLAIAVPKLELFISLFGALCLSALGLAFPPMIDLSTYWYVYTGTEKKINIVKNVLLIVMGIAGLIIGTFVSMKKIVESFNNP